jgi:hypothetical protein
MAPRRTARRAQPAEPERLLAAFARMKNVLARRKKDRSYSTEYKRYCRFVEANGLRSADGGESDYIHRDAVDAYFFRDVVNRGGQKNNINRIASSIQWCYDNVEQPGGTGPTFTIRSNVVKASIAQQQQNWKNRGSIMHLGSDPHKGLKDLMPLADKLIVARNIHGRADWGSLGMSFSWGCNAGVRGASSRKFVYADLNLSRGFGPEKEGPRSRCILLVLRKGDAHKDRSDTDKQVGVWRHRNYLLCSVFNTALHVIDDLRKDTTINFYHVDKKTRATWWDKQLIEYEETGGQESAAMTQVYAETGVESCKLTHNRTHAVQLGGSEGLAPWQLNTFTKHMLDKLNSAYQPEMNRETAKVMAAFEKDEPYFHGSSNLEHPVPVGTLIDFLLPNYRMWKRQANSAEGDKSSCCRKFLNEVIPYLVEVLVQDGIFLIRDFPNHPMSNYLKVRILTTT